jgi:hypothetical protein
MNTVAKPVVKNKFWIVERDGEKLATIQAVEENGGFVYVHDNQREHFPSIKLLSMKYNIEFVKADRKTKPPVDNTVYGFPVQGHAHNQVLDVQRYLPIYTKGLKSKSFFCAGHYIVKFGNDWTNVFCPKLITLNRYPYQGPFKTLDRVLEIMKETNE